MAESWWADGIFFRRVQDIIDLALPLSQPSTPVPPKSSQGPIAQPSTPVRDCPEISPPSLPVKGRGHGGRAVSSPADITHKSALFVNQSYKPDKFGKKNARNFDEDLRSLTVMQELESAILELSSGTPRLATTESDSAPKTGIHNVYRRPPPTSPLSPSMRMGENSITPPPHSAILKSPSPMRGALGGLSVPRSPLRTYGVRGVRFAATTSSSNSAAGSQEPLNFFDDNLQLGGCRVIKSLETGDLVVM